MSVASAVYVGVFWQVAGAQTGDSLSLMVMHCKQRSRPEMKMLRRFQASGSGEGVTRSWLSAIMAPSLNTASSTMSSVGKYLQHRHSWEVAERKRALLLSVTSSTKSSCQKLLHAARTEHSQSLQGHVHSLGDRGVDAQLCSWQQQVRLPTADALAACRCAKFG